MLRWPKWAQALRRQLLATNFLKILFGFYFIAANVGQIYDVQFPRFIEAFMFVAQAATSLGLQGLSLWMPCVGIRGYLLRLQFWMVLPACIALLIVLIAALHLVVRSPP